ncbi:MAG: hypothetical protein K6F78_07345 [Bacteroidaceae bacterium]|nr:hypothetical protein [Bacteroidaceae bacterium]
MEERIKQTVATLKRNFAYMWFAALLIIILGETGGFNLTGAYADNPRMVYYAETVIILLYASCVPVAMTFFDRMRRKKMDAIQSTDEALNQYLYWSTIRLLLITVPVITGLIGYYLFQSTSCILCACICLTASLFCIPSEKQLRKDLKIDK